MLVARLAVFAVGAVIVQAVLRSAVRTVVVPRGEQPALTRLTFAVVRVPFDALARVRGDVEGREQTLARYAPAALLTVVLMWVLGVIAGFVFLFWAADGERTWSESIYLSGSSITTLGMRAPETPAGFLLAFAEAVIGLGIVALMISYLPTLYSLYSAREAEVVKLDVRAGSPPTALELFTRMQRVGWLDALDPMWESWEQWFVELEESHTSHPALQFFRSRRLGSNWTTAAGAVLDAAAIATSVLAIDQSAQAAITMRAGFLALRSIAQFQGIPVDTDPAPNAPISVHRQEFDLLLDELTAIGLPVVEDREQAWRDFAGWRVNYDRALIGLCALVEAPAASWSADRIDGWRRPGVLHKHWVVPALETPPSW
ncbi:MAG: two pore domain potassium channel family protein [Acidimicrobiales bacterium]|nr:two pore domain potassium channel family protein [Acidimicrobiales bacterium]MCB1261761.1 two pore domain potassium channel family protein [Acidimicrobiales bacterium]